jgi:hypothetical protein
MSNRFACWPARPHPVLAVLLTVAICLAPILLGHMPGARDLLPITFSYVMCCLLIYPCAAILRRRVTSLPALIVVGALAILALSYYHTNVIFETADLPWPQRRDITLDKFFFNLPQVTLSALCWWLLVVRPDQRQR